MKASLLALGVLALTGCQSGSDDGLPPAGPYQQAAIYSRQHDGRELLVMQGNQLVYQDDENGGGITTPVQLFSGTKTFNCALSAAAVGDGLLSSLDENVSATLTEWQSDPRKSAITVRELLNMTSGLSQSLLNFYDLFKSSSYSATITASATAGTVFDYGETSIAVFEELMARKLRASTTFSTLDPLGYLKARVFDRMGLSYAQWLRNLEGQPILSFGAVVSASEWIKYGQLLRDHGVWNGAQVVPSAGIDACTTASAVFAGYGIGLWINAPMPSGFGGIPLAQYAGPSFTGGGPTGLLEPGGPADLVAAAGLTDQRMYIVRSQNLIVVRLGHGGINSDWNDATFLKLFL